MIKEFFIIAYVFFCDVCECEICFRCDPLSEKIKESTGAYSYLPTITENDTMLKILNKYGVSSSETISSVESQIDTLLEKDALTFADEEELARLHVIDSQLEQEQMSLENQLKLLDAEEKAVEKQMDEEINSRKKGIIIS